MKPLAQIVQHIADARFIWSGAWRRLVVGNAIRIWLARHGVGHIDRRNGRGRAGQVWSGIYWNRHGQSSLVEKVQHVSRHIVPAGRAA